MRASEYKNIFLSEASHFYYRGYHSIITQLLKKIIPKYSDKFKILDAGCGTGLFSKRLNQFGEVQAIDISARAINFAKKHGIKVRQASVTKIPFKNSSFDLITSLDVLYHQSVKDEKLAVKEFNRVLKPQGVLVLKLPAFNFLKDSHDLSVHTRCRYTLPRVRDLLIKNNFCIIRSSYIGSFLFFPKLFMSLKTKITSASSQSAIRSTNPLLNQVLIFMFKLEGILLNFLDIPFGISILIFAKKELPPTLNNTDIEHDGN